MAINQVNPGCEWVINGEGVPTRKWDGTCCMVQETVLYKRFDAKQGATPPAGFVPAQDPDPVTGHWPGWLKVNVTRTGDKLIADDSADKWIVEGLANSFPNYPAETPADGTYEAVGPKINGSRDGFAEHKLIQHGDAAFTPEPPRDFEGLKAFFGEQCTDIEGIVWHHPDGRLCKIKRSDFGLKW
ncbi:hypothetical protein F0L74_08295 [Chitinophaga agrisoli]|uniref:Uncharacterized protein n=1 Tax=Chitinophaga agrisoli TaxID=2607653 RepID=A0A5B2VVK6_9BACT|nr:hypothetical protein F0L74_08295 [Chitinophaga agrisoli]